MSVDAIDKGIALYPDRLDFRLAKVSAYDYRNDMDALSEAAVDILELSRIGSTQWKWTEDSLLHEDKAKEIMFDYLHDFERIMVEHSYNNKLLDLNLEYYPEDPVALTLKGSIEYEAGRMEDAQKYLERAYRVSPEDPLIVSNLAYISFAMGDRDKAEALYTAVVESDKADDESKEAAKNMINRMNEKLKEIDLYSFEFQFLPMFARELKPGETALEILCNKQYIIGIILPGNGYSIPVDIGEIRVDKIGNGDGAIVVWTMPEPKKIPLARYIAFVPDMAGDNYSVYTLERSLDWDGNGPLWVLGLTQKSGHSNFG
ncbi:MAG: tetratricopeptide repeat protein, partial [Muribaculaceae bacterium]|nr:tetratricopeptide repeat protein [Muribaculaceae bacterium]